MNLHEKISDREALIGAAGWDRGDGVLAAFARRGGICSEVELESVRKRLCEALEEAELRAEEMGEDPVWRIDCFRLRRALEIANESILEPETGLVVCMH